MKREIAVATQRRNRNRRRVGPTSGQIAAKRLTTAPQVGKLGAFFGRSIEFEVFHLVIAERQLKTVAKGDQRIDIELLCLMRGHSGLARAAHSVSLLGLGEDRCRLAFRPPSRLEGRKEFAKVVAAALQRVDFAIGHMGNQSARFLVFRKEMLEIVRPVLGAERLIFAVDSRREAAKQDMIPVAFEERVPLRTPQDLDDVPARAAKQPFEFLDDLPVAAHRSVKPLQIAVDDEGQIVEPLARGER